LQKGLPRSSWRSVRWPNGLTCWSSFLESCHHFYPSLMTVIERLLPTYPRHAAGASGRYGTSEQMVGLLDLRLGMTHEAGELIQLIASLHWDQVELGSPADIPQVIQSVAKACAPKSIRHIFGGVNDIAKAKIRRLVSRARFPHPHGYSQLDAALRSVSRLRGAEISILKPLTLNAASNVNRIPRIAVRAGVHVHRISGR